MLSRLLRVSSVRRMSLFFSPRGLRVTKPVFQNERRLLHVARQQACSAQWMSMFISSRASFAGSVAGASVAALLTSSVIGGAIFAASTGATAKNFKSFEAWFSACHDLQRAMYAASSSQEKIAYITELEALYAQFIYQARCGRKAVEELSMIPSRFNELITYACRRQSLASNNSERALWQKKVEQLDASKAEVELYIKTVNAQERIRSALRTETSPLVARVVNYSVAGAGIGATVTALGDVLWKAYWGEAQDFKQTGRRALVGGLAGGVVGASVPFFVHYFSANEEEFYQQHPWLDTTSIYLRDAFIKYGLIFIKIGIFLATDDYSPEQAARATEATRKELEDALKNAREKGEDTTEIEKDLKKVEKAAGDFIATLKERYEHRDEETCYFIQVGQEIFKQEQKNGASAQVAVSAPTPG